MSIRSVESAILTVLTSVPGVKVYDHEPKALEYLPAITLKYTGFEQNWRSFGKHDLTYRWELNLYVSIGNDPKSSLNQMKDLINQFIDAFRLNPTLNDTVRIADITSGSLEVETNLQNPRYRHTLQLEAVEEGSA